MATQVTAPPRGSSSDIAKLLSDVKRPPGVGERVFTFDPDHSGGPTPFAEVMKGMFSGSFVVPERGKG